MRTKHSNSKRYITYCKLMLAIMFIISTVLFLKPTTIYATSINTKGYNGTSADAGERALLREVGL